MNRMGALLTLLISMGIGFIIWKALDERLDVRYKLLKRFRILRDKPWLIVAGMMGLILFVGVFFLIFKVPEAAYYAVSGVAITSALMLISSKTEDFDDGIVKPEKTGSPAPEDKPADTEAEPSAVEETASPEEEKAPEEAPAEEKETPSEETPVPEEEAPSEEEKKEPEEDTPSESTDTE
ncbi:MAG: hypothetical protein IKP95_08250 [Ruminococcus sp.]|nr:hypothetical protein [Ruminococcus sp.]